MKLSLSRSSIHPGGVVMSRISKERMQKALEQEQTISKADHAKIKAIAGW
jgi:hypothetical protein